MPTLSPRSNLSRRTSPASVCLNLIGNGFYAATKRQKEGSDPKFKPTLKVSTRDLGDTVEVPDNDASRGMVRQVRFLVTVEELPAEGSEKP